MILHYATRKCLKEKKNYGFLKDKIINILDKN